MGNTTVVLHTGGLQYESEKAVLEKALGALPGVLFVEANPQTATVRYDPGQTNVAELRKWVEECGYHCAGKSVPAHICSPMEEARNNDGVGGLSRAGAVGDAAEAPGAHAGHAGHDMAAIGRSAVAKPEQPMHAPHAEMVMAPSEAMGHGGHAGASMASMVRDMRNRFLVALLLSIPILHSSRLMAARSWASGCPPRSDCGTTSSN